MGWGSVCVTVCGGGRAAAAASGDLMLMRSVMGANREREQNRFGLHWQAHSPYALQYARLFIPPISMCLCSDLSPANDSKIALPPESYASATEHLLFMASLFYPPYHSPQAQSGAAKSRVKE